MDDILIMKIQFIYIYSVYRPTYTYFIRCFPIFTGSSTSIQCTIGAGTGTNEPILVSVFGMGRASGDFEFTYLEGSTGITPTPLEGSTNGKMGLKLKGIYSCRGSGLRSMLRERK